MANEKRLIDANALLKKMQFRLPINDKISEVIAECVSIAVRYIKNAPTIDAVPVVRCKDCKDFGGHGKCYYHAADISGTPIFVLEDDFCSYGERREGE